MPYVWVEPAVAAEVCGLPIYYTYKNDVRNQHIFTTAEWQDDSEGDYGGETLYQFDIRNLDIPADVPEDRKLEYVIRHRLVRWPEDDPEMLGNEEWLW
jgi:hypothetical protein